MLVYQPEQPIDAATLQDLGDPAGLGGTVLAGAPRISIRIDYQRDTITAGIFEATTGTVRIVFPFTEHATILEGQVTITDADGQRHTYGPGDSYFIEQGAVVLWEVTAPRVRKSFFNIVNPAAETATG
ncbi:MAG TPA: cupin domain-containing protein [Herpetosiphonaceae bacterium]